MPAAVKARTLVRSLAVVGLLLCLAQAAPVLAGSPPPHRHGWDRHHSRHHHHHPHYAARRYYTQPAYVVVDRLPRHYQRVVYRDQLYYHHGANWYRPYGAGYAMVAAPGGLIIDGRGVTVVAQAPLIRW